VCLENRGDYTWQLYHPEGKRVDLVIRCDGTLLATHVMPRAVVHPGERVTVHFPLRLLCGEGVHELQMELVEQQVTCFSDQGVDPLRWTLVVEPAPVSQSARLYEEAARISPWYYQPTQGVGRSLDGRLFPLFISKAKGCYLWESRRATVYRLHHGLGVCLAGLCRGARPESY
jgi:hypothetical protein